VWVKTETLVRLSGAAAIAGGATRIVTSFIPWRQQVALEAVYDAIDVLLLFGVIGAYLSRAQKLGGFGLFAFALAVAALSFIGGPDADAFGFSTYYVGASVLVVAMALLGVTALVRRAMPIWAPACWLASLAGGAVFTVVPWTRWAFIAAGVLFGAGFVAIGLDMIQGARRQA
jgi:hypothetical protein